MTIRRVRSKREIERCAVAISVWEDDQLADLLRESEYVVAYHELSPYSGQWLTAGVAGMNLGPQTAVLTAAAVDPAFRGQGIQRKLIEARVRYAKSKGVRRVHTYAHAENTASLVSLLKCGFRPVSVTRPPGFVNVERQLWE